MSEKEFSLEDSEELITGLKSGAHSDFEHLRSALNLLAHVPEVSPISMPPVLPSTISQPVPLVPIKSSKPRRTIVTSIAVVGLFASGSLAAAAVTGIGPSIIVNAGHSAAKFVKNVVGGVGLAVTGGNSESNQNQASAPVIPGVTTTLPPTTPSSSISIPIPNSTDDNNQNESEHSSLILPLVSNLIPPLTLPLVSNSNSSDDGSQTPNAEETHQATPRVEKTQQPSEDQNQSESNPSEKSTPEASRTPSAEKTSQPTAEPTSEPESQSSAGISILPTAEPTITTSAEASVTPTESPDDSNN